MDNLADKEHADILLALLNDEPIEKLLWQCVKPDEKASWFTGRG